MRKMTPFLLLGILLTPPLSASAQGEVALSFVTVQLWPEYDQPNMLVIVDFQIAENVPLPAALTFHIPSDASLIAVATDAGDGQFLNAPYEGPAVEGEYQVFGITMDMNRPYRFEYYQPLSFEDDRRRFSYLWGNGYAVEEFRYIFLEPLDVTDLDLDPAYASREVSGELNYYGSAPISLKAGGRYSLSIDYRKTTDTLVVQTQAVQIAEPINEDTPGRVSLANSLPYIIGALGVIMIAGGLTYYFQWGRASGGKARRRVHSRAENDGANVYCPQCGSRAKPSDRFCRTCGARLRRDAA